MVVFGTHAREQAIDRGIDPELIKSRLRAMPLLKDIIAVHHIDGKYRAVCRHFDSVVFVITVTHEKPKSSRSRTN